MTPNAPESPPLSVVVTVVDGGAALQALLTRLSAQTGTAPLEIIVPFDATIADVGGLAGTFPAVRFLPLGALAIGHDARSGAGQHALFDMRRAAGLAAATAPLIGMLEDRALPGPDWAAAMQRLHADLPHAVIGGPIGTTAPDALNWAFHACDFTRYAPPLQPGPRPFVSDVNLCYKRRALEATRAIWAVKYNEVKVHWALEQQGETLYLSDAPIVWHRSHYARLAPLLRERFDWGRLFGAARASQADPPSAAALALRAPIVPVVLWLRLLRAHASLGSVGRFLEAAPAIAAMQVAWVAGETWGGLTRRS